MSDSTCTIVSSDAKASKVLSSENKLLPFPGISTAL